MAGKKKTLYEILEVSPNASLSEIQTAHKRLSRKLVSGELGLSREDIDFQLKVIDIAFQTLSVPTSRDAYDAQLAPLIEPSHAVAALKAPLKDDPTALKIAAALAESDRISSALVTSHESPLKVVSTTIESSAKSLKKILRVIAGLMVLGVVIKGGAMILTNRQTAHPTGDVSTAEEKVRLQEYYQEHGVRPGSRIEADLLEVENRRKENKQRAEALEKQKKDEEYKRFVEESRQLGDRVSENLRREEERTRYQVEQKQREAEQEKLRMEEAENERIEANRKDAEEARRRLGYQ